MKIFKNEKSILNFIKITPIISVFLLSLFITQVFLNERENRFEEEIKQTKQEYLQKNKQKVKNEIERIYNFLIFEKNKAEETLRNDIKSRVYEAHSIAMSVFNRKKNSYSKKEIFESIKSILENMSYQDGKGYFFIFDKKGRSLLQAKNKKIEQNNLLTLKDKKGYAFVKTIVDTINEKSERYDSYYWYKSDNDNDTYKKISFYKYLEPFDIVIGTGFYLDDFENKLKTSLLSRIKTIQDKDSSYIFIFDSIGNVLAHHKDSLLGTNRYNIINPLGISVVKNIVDFGINEKEGFLSYHSKVNPENLDSSSKISYLKLVDDWNWIMGTGFYLESFNKRIEEKTKMLSISKQESINKIITFSAVLTFILLLISFYISSILSSMFITYKNKLEEELENTIAKEEMLFKQSKLAAMGEMIANIAHQWRQPLSAISASATGVKLQKEMNCLTDEQLDLSMIAINNSAQYLSQTIEDFRGFLDPRNTKETEFEISGTIQKTLNLVNSQFKTKDIQIIKNIQNITLVSKENELIQIIVNILNNAKDALYKIKDKQRYVFIDTYLQDEIFYLEIKDNADGIDKTIMDRIFEPYFTTKHKSIGTGIGLYMSQNIVRNHLYGDITVKNEVYDYAGEKQKGAKFIISIKLSKKEE